MSARRPLGPVADASRYADQLGLWDAPVEEREAILHASLSEPIGEYCRCGKELIRVNAGSGVCLASMKAMEDEAQDPTHEQRMSSMGVPPAYHHCRQASLLLDDPAAYTSMARAANPYGDRHAAERIVKAVLEREKL